MQGLIPTLPLQGFGDGGTKNGFFDVRSHDWFLRDRCERGGETGNLPRDLARRSQMSFDLTQEAK
jgi:hypothetical protein